MNLKAITSYTSVTSVLFIIIASYSNSTDSKQAKSKYRDDNVIIMTNIAHKGSANTVQKLYLYLQGSYVGKPKYTKIDFSPRPTFKGITRNNLLKISKPGTEGGIHKNAKRTNGFRFCE